jgi:hypothetical protein
VDYSRFKANVLKRAVPKESFANVDGDAKYGLKIVAAKARRGK